MIRLIALSLIALMVVAAPASADNIGSMFGYSATARTMGQGQAGLSASVGVTDLTSFVAGFSYGFSDKVDGRIRLGAVEDDFINTSLAIGTDLNWQVMDMRPTTAGKASPFDMSVGTFFEYLDLNIDDTDDFIDSQNMWQLGGSVTGSYTHHMDNGMSITPYGRLNLRYERYEITFNDSVFGGEDVSDSQLAAGLNAGAAWAPSPRVNLFGEFQVDGNNGLFLGVNFMP